MQPSLRGSQQVEAPEADAPRDNAHASAPKGARYTLFLLFVINFLNFFDRMLPAVALEPIRKEFSLNDAQLGMLITAFTLIYAVAGIPIGRLSDRMKRTRILSGGLLTWSLLTAATALSWNYASLLLVRLGVGIGEASCAPAANAMIGDMFPSTKRARALGLFMLGLPLGGLTAFGIAGVLIQKYGWRMPFYAAAVPGVVVALLILFVAEPVRGSQEVYRVHTVKRVERPFRRILAIPTVWWIILSGAAGNFAAYAMNAFLATLLMRYHKLDVANAGAVSAVVLGATGLVGLTAGGVLADKLHQIFPRGRLTLGAVALLAASPLLWIGFAQAAGSVAALTFFLSTGWLLFFLYYTTVYSSLQDVVEPQLRATAMAVYFFFQYVLGGAAGALIAGALSDFYAKQAMAAAGATQMTDAFRALGLQSALQMTVPTASLVTGLALWCAARSFVADAEKTRLAAQMAS